MDVLNHGLWGSLIMYPKYHSDKKKILAGFLFGILPDVLVFAPIFAFTLFGGLRFSPALFADLENASWVFRYAWEGYNYTHSLVVCVAVILILLAVRRGQIYWPILAWPLHIFMDIPTHPNFFHTPILFPISDYEFTHGVHWSNPILFTINYALLTTIFLYFRKKYNKKSEHRVDDNAALEDKV